MRQLHEHGNEVQAKAGNGEPENTDVRAISPNLLEFHVDNSKGWNEIQRLEQIGTFVTIHEGVDDVG